ncbi:unnamed protein product [Paramecium pentaurelia]|uniref:Uncharacterized protein n=1 Tax=Paramecium pentaurelia TaxID=43138 RepID=A0A8S1SPV2_9CILI|nr:unnamed protein product [Paramecium pentaurelia]
MVGIIWKIKSKGRKMDSNLKQCNYEKCRRILFKYSTGNKQGQWKTLIENYWSEAKVYEVGEYQDGIRKDWKYIYKNQKMIGGRYNQEDQKHGKWVELSKNFQDDIQVKYNGEYKNGKKIGLWDIEYWCERRNHFIKIGGGAYNEVGDGLQSGNWVEISDNKNFEYDEQIIYIGKYKNGKKVGRWDIWCDVFDEKIFKIMQQNYINMYSSGGVLYDEAGEGLKIGEWIDFNEGFDEQKQVTYHGEYKNDKKVGMWDIWNLCLSKYDQLEKYIGGGLYDEDGEEIKLGKWVQVSDIFRSCSATYNREYKNGKKVGQNLNKGFLYQCLQLYFFEVSITIPIYEAKGKAYGEGLENTSSGLVNSSLGLCLEANQPRLTGDISQRSSFINSHLYLNIQKIDLNCQLSLYLSQNTKTKYKFSRQLMQLFKCNNNQFLYSFDENTLVDQFQQIEEILVI